MGGRKKKAENLVAMSVICFLFGFATNGGLFLPTLFQLVSRVVSSLITLQSLFQKAPCPVWMKRKGGVCFFLQFDMNMAGWVAFASKGRRLIDPLDG